MSNSEWEEQREAARLLEQYGGLRAPQDERSKYETYQPPVFETSVRRVAEDLILSGFTFRRVEPRENGGWNYVFAARGAETAKAAKLSEQGKLSFEESPRISQARKHAQEEIRAAILDHQHQQNMRSS